ncbi:hypothetical protein Ahy_B01g054112 isoform I [Arachis hypogaea]|uniref:Uncharacterized protein n=1 Tax=Arachis hypogaea TaxID=3818 RepID=A0A445ATC3_ARAHY|nr:hypothetical protein Ahy_B01g054112 isoform I [Arachis hypogaea]
MRSGWPRSPISACQKPDQHWITHT